MTTSNPWQADNNTLDSAYLEDQAQGVIFFGCGICRQTYAQLRHLVEHVEARHYTISQWVKIERSWAQPRETCVAKL